MSDHDHTGTSEHHLMNTKPYLVVFVLLSIFTLVSFVANYFVQHDSISAATGFVLILGVAVVKAVLVATYFMHLKWDWSKLYFLIIPAFVLAPMALFALLPDIVLYWKVLYR